MVLHFFLVSDIKDNIKFLKVVFIMLMAHFSFLFLLRLSKYVNNRTLKCFKKNVAILLNYQL